VNEDDIRRIVREEIVKAFGIFEEATGGSRYGIGDLERSARDAVEAVTRDAIKKIEVSRNGSRAQCAACDEWDNLHEEWCPRGA
jgi:hypothetical protein